MVKFCKLLQVWDAAWHEYACTQPTGTDMIADFEAVLSAQNVHHLVAVAMEVERCFGAGRDYRLERHDTLPALLVLQLQRAVLPGAMFHTGSCHGSVT